MGRSGGFGKSKGKGKGKGGSISAGRGSFRGGGRRFSPGRGGRGFSGGIGNQGIYMAGKGIQLILSYFFGC